MRVAIVYDRVNKFGGAEQVLLALHQIWPDAPLYTAVYHPQTSGWANVFRVIPSFLQAVPLATSHHEFFPWLTPLAFESFSFDDYDLVISVTSAEAKNIITKPDTLHVCYCLTPTRYLWSGAQTYKERPGMGMFSQIAKVALQRTEQTLRRWDLMAAQRPDFYIAISDHVKARIEHYYQRPVAAVIYPPVDTTSFTVAKQSIKRSGFIVVSRLVGYKRLDLLIDAFNLLEIPLTIIGEGKDKAALQARAKKNIRFITHKLTNAELADEYQQSLAFIFAGQEDFGIAAAEAQACGIPVLCYADSGMAEIIVPGQTGAVFRHQSVESIVETVRQFDPLQYNPNVCRQRALKFDTIIFQKQMQQFIKEQL